MASKMLKRKYFILFIFLGVFAITFSVMATNSKESFESIQATENFPIDDLTLLERKYVDADSDGKKESVELYTSAKIASDGRMGWDTGHHWVLLVRKGDEVYPLFNDSVQYGEVQFWIVSLNKDNIQGPEGVDLQTHIYATVSSDVDMRLLNYSWDKKNHYYNKEIVFNPNNQWITIHSNKYSIPDPSRIQSEKIAN